MSFAARFVISGDDKLRATIVAKLDALSDLRPVLALTGAIARDAAKVRIRTEGANLDPPWIPALKTRSISFPGRYGLGLVSMQGSGGRTGYDLGTMSNSIEYQIPTATSVRIGTDVPYAYWFQHGSGVFAGHQPWTIYPRTKQALSWVFGGRRFFARSVTIKGQPPRAFLFFEEADIKAIMAAWQQHLSRTA